jgi:hypothetical protein
LKTVILCLAAFERTGSDQPFQTATPSSPGYDGGTHFCCPARQGCRKLARIKLVVDNMFGDKTLLIIQTNFIIIAVKDDKC